MPAARQARRSVGCPDCAICADPAPGRVGPVEHWEPRTALEEFRSNGPHAQQRPPILAAPVQECDIADVWPAFGADAR